MRYFIASTDLVIESIKLDTAAAELCKSNLELASYKLALTDAKLSMAEYRLSLMKHWNTCTNCQSNNACDIVGQIPFPNFE